MIKISTRTRYSIRIMLYLADHMKDGKPITLGEISRRQKISLRYIEQLVVPLKNAGLVRSVAGRYGGYYLAKRPAHITINDIVEASSGPVRVINCVRNPHCCDFYGRCSTRRMWEVLNATMVKILKDFRLEDLSRRKMRLKGKAKIDKWLSVKC